MMERLRIEYGMGYMELIVEAFFPCKMPAMRKAARLINSYCTDEARAALLSELRELADGYKVLCEMYTKKAEGLPVDSPERRHWRAQFNKTEVLRKRMENNIRLISGGREG
ncbi:hypothetical protein D3Z47_11910 [Lachnospiraceae bacterium]|nr:hypothetical protein [Lachnospiraceae bacterium]